MVFPLRPPSLSQNNVGDCNGLSCSGKPRASPPSPPLFCKPWEKFKQPTELFLTGLIFLIGSEGVRKGSWEVLAEGSWAWGRLWDPSGDPSEPDPSLLEPPSVVPLLVSPSATSTAQQSQDGGTFQVWDRDLCGAHTTKLSPVWCLKQKFQTPAAELCP